MRPQDLCQRPYAKVGISERAAFRRKLRRRSFLRHTFCVHRLDDWVREGRDVSAMLPYLSAYVGHSSIESTDYYLHLVPDFFGEYAQLTERRSSAIPGLGEGDA